MRLTNEQLLAVKTNEIPICISAGAGSGKTRVLVEKFWQLLELGFEIDEILAVTFTRKAAREMIERIRSRVDQSDLDPTRKRALKDGLSKAWIGTIDSICSRIIRDYPIEADIDPYFNIADEMTINQLKYEIARDIVLEKISIQEPNLLEYIEVFGYSQTLDDMQTLLNIMIMKGISLEKIVGVTWQSITEVENNLSNVVTGIEHVYDSILATAPNLNEKTQTYRKVAQMAANKDKWLQAIAAVGNLSGNDSEWETFKNLQDIGKGSLSAEVKEHFGELKTLLSQLEGSIVDINNKKYLTTLFSLTKSLRDKFIVAKAERNLLEYTDLESKAIDILKEYPDILSVFQNQFKHIMVDEFQDTNYRQVELIEIISNNYKNCVFAVGDPKQSIYRFRGAQVSLFAKTNNKIEIQGGLSHCLSKNFRTRSILIGFINSIFAQLMQDSDELGFQALVAARPSQIEDHIEMHLIKQDGEAEIETDEAEAYCLANRIIQMVSNGEKIVYEKIGTEEIARPVRYADIAILFQKSKTMDLITAVFSEYDIPYFVVGSHGFFTTEEVNTVILFLKVVSNYFDEISLTGLLRSSMFGVSDEALWYLKEKCHDIYEGLLRLEEFSTSLKRTDYNALRLALHLINYLRDNKARLSIAEIILKIIKETNYDLFLACQPNGDQKLANLKKLTEVAETKTIDSYDEIGEFLHYISKAKERTALDEQQAVLDSEASNAVKLMTIHQAKGLEFPVVIIPHLNQRFNTTDATDKVVFCDEIGLFLNTEPKGYLRVKAQEQELNLILEEYKRLFYVAQTRACDYLILSGCYQQRKEKDTYVPAAPKNSWLNWLFEHYEVTSNPVNENFEKDGIKTYLYEQSAITPHENIGKNPEVRSGLSKYEFNAKDYYPRNEYISATRLMDYKFCPFYAHLKYNHGLSISLASKNDINEESLDAVNIGTIIHKVIEENDSLLDAKGSLEEILSIVNGVNNEQKLQLQKMLENYYENDFIKKLNANYKLLKEVPFLARLNSNVFLNGFIDQLWIGENTYHILDLKTGRNDSNNENRYNEQLNFYQKALDKILFRDIDSKGIFYLGNDKLQKVNDEFIDFEIKPNPSPEKTGLCDCCINKYICLP